ncbi:MAG: HTH domain-containing protein [Haloarculaceae archaeon]
MDPTPKPRIELYVRSLLPDGAHERQDAVIERLRDLEASGDVEDFSVIVWGKQVSRESAAGHTETGRYVLNRVAEFEQWALSHNVSLSSFYQTQAVGDDGDASTAITLPVMGLAEYADGQLRHVAPCTVGDTIHTIVDRLDGLEAGKPPAFDATADGLRVA